MDATEIGMEEFLSKKRCHKINFNCIGTGEKTLISTQLWEPLSPSINS